mmetsp:Transcript_130078/g.328297  ORF Transcript_130078/g.328297 Transcript_130078/m.328297 type:complete len:236 (+) Transcript_130078:113-820(+)
MFDCCCCECTDEKAQVVSTINDERAATSSGEQGDVVVAASGAGARKAEREPEEAPEPLGEQAPVTFVAVIVKEKGSDDVGWHLDLLDKKVPWVSRIVTTEKTPIKQYNANVPAERHVREGDYIKRVNKEASSAQAMRSAIKGDVRLEILIHRPHLYSETIVKGGESLGLDLMFGPGSASMLIEEVRSGAVKASCPSVQRRDRIVKVNGQQGNSDLLMQAIKASDTLDVEFSRCSD